MKNSEYIEEIIHSLEKNFIPLNTLSKINDGIEFDREAVVQMMKNKASEKKIVPNVYLLMLGYKQDKYLHKLSDFLTVIAKKSGKPMMEVFEYFFALLLLENAGEEDLLELEVSEELRRFISGNVYGENEILYVLLKYILNFLYTTTKFVYAVSKKHEHARPDERLKIIKLYFSKTRIDMLIQSAENAARESIEKHKAIASQSEPVIKEINLKSRGIITPMDLFEEKYDF